MAPTPTQLDTSPVHEDNHAHVPTLAGSSPVTSAPSRQLSTQGDEGDTTDLGEVVDSDEYLSTGSEASGDQSDTDDSDMAKQIEAAGEGESLLGSDDSSDEAHLADEEEYIINDEMNRSKLKNMRQKSSSERPDEGSRSGSAATEEEMNFDDDNEFWNTLSPARESADDVIGDEMFKPQRGFANSPEPSFSDFFGSSDEVEDTNAGGDDDDEMLTTDEDTESISDSSSTISSASVSAPLIAHFGSTKDLDGKDNAEQSNIDEEKSLKSAIPLLVIEDLDGRLIYARAGDGEAVFGSDGEFEFVGESEDDSSSDDMMEPKGQAASRFCDQSHSPQSGFLESSNVDTQSMETGDEGETTDELPDEDMPYPRLLIGSVAPRGGRNARRAREIAARSRKSSPRVSSPAPVSAYASRAGSRTPSSLSNVVSAADADSDTESNEPVPDVSPSASGTPQDAGQTDERAHSLHDDLETGSEATPRAAKPEMGQFIPALSKSVHRAVIDGSSRAPSPFSSNTPLQHGFGKKRPAPRPGLSEDSLEHALCAPSRLKRKRGGIPTQVTAPYKNITDYGLQSGKPAQAGSSPEVYSPSLEDTMDIKDVLDENIIWEDASSDSGSEEELQASEGMDDGNLSQGSSSRQQRRDRSKMPCAPGLNYNAFARWNRIPMGAFRDSQKQSNSGLPPPMTDVYATHQRPSGTYLLTHPFSTSRHHHLSNAVTPPARQLVRGKDRSPFQRGFQHGVTSPLHRTLADSSTLQSLVPAQSPLNASLAWYPSNNGTNDNRRSANIGDHTVVGGNFLVSPKLTPVKHSTRGSGAGNLGAPSAPGPFPHSRKVTKREKRERQARREAMKRERSLDHSPQFHDGHNPSPSPLSYHDTSLAS